MFTLRKASEPPFPYTAVSYIRVSTDGSIHFMNSPKSKTDKRELISLLEESKTTGAKFIAPWVGRYKTDIFEIDDVDKAIEELSMYL